LCFPSKRGSFPNRFSGLFFDNAWDMVVRAFGVVIAGKITWAIQKITWAIQSGKLHELYIQKITWAIQSGKLHELYIQKITRAIQSGKLHELYNRENYMSYTIGKITWAIHTHMLP
jgi:TM2 domain-containing membrane protein YozV